MADIVKALAVPSLLTAPLVEITAPSPLANNTELPLSVIAPVYVWLPMELTLPARLVAPLTLN